MTLLSRRQIDVLRTVFTDRRLNVRAIADKLGSPNRLSGDLIDLVQKRCLHMEREGNMHIYTITALGARTLAKYEEMSVGASIKRLGEMELPRDITLRLQSYLKNHVKMTWCPSCMGTNIDPKGGVIEHGDGSEEWIRTCKDCGEANLTDGTLGQYESLLRDQVKQIILEKKNRKDVW